MSKYLLYHYYYNNYLPHALCILLQLLRVAKITHAYVCKPMPKHTKKEFIPDSLEEAV